MIASLIGLGGFLAGAGFTLMVARGRGKTDATLQPDDAEVRESGPLESKEAAEAEAELPSSGGLHLLTLVAQALRTPLMRLRGVETIPAELIAGFERVAWQARMLASRGRPMQAKPALPIALLQEAAEQVELLRLGKVGASWTLLTRQPVQLDPERARAAFRELFTTAVERVGEGGRIGVRICDGDDPGFPVQVEIEIGRRGSEPDPLAFLVARHLLESQGARVEQDGRVTRIHLRSVSAGLDRATESSDH
jgi:hypothetical protein